MVPTIVPVYAAVLAFVYIALSARVIQARRSAKVAIGTRGSASRLWLAALFMLTASLKSMRTTDYGRLGWRRPSLSLP
jgi:uncharacterized membrane protein YecN with MAPEG domain